MAKSLSISPLRKAVSLLALSAFLVPAFAETEPATSQSEQVALPETSYDHIAELTARAESGEAGAQVALGTRYAFAQGVERDFSKAVYWWKKAVEQGDPAGHYFLGRAYAFGVGGLPQDFKKAEELMLAAAEKDETRAQVWLGKEYVSGNFLAWNLEAGVRWLLCAAELGDSDAHYELGWMYLNGIGVPQNAEEAFKWAKLAAESKAPNALCGLGFFYTNGIACEQDVEKAIALFKEAAEQGFTEAQRNLGLIYLKGHGVAKNLEEAIRFLTMAANEGNIEAQMNLAYCYYKGEEDVPVDFKKAVKWFRRAAENGNAEGQYMLASCYNARRGVEADLSEEMKWLRAAAEQGLAEAEYSLGRAVFYGYDGIPADIFEAEKWFLRAAEHGIYGADLYALWGREWLEGKHYVQAGDTLYTLAKIFNTTVEELMRLNPDIENRDEIFRSKNLTLPPPPNREGYVQKIRHAAEKGDADAQYMLAGFYRDGVLLECDKQNEIKWLRTAAEQGHANAVKLLVMHFLHGKGGVPVDFAEAKKWLLLAEGGMVDLSEAAYLYQSVFNDVYERSGCDVYNDIVYVRHIDAWLAGEYAIHAGDTLFSLAEVFNTTVDELMRLNPDIVPENLQIGQKIKLPPPPNVKCIEEMQQE